MQDLCSRSFPSLPQVSVQKSVSLHGPNTKCAKYTSQVNLCLPVHCYLCILCFHTAPPSVADTKLLTPWYRQQAPGTLSQPLDLHSRMSSWTSRNSGILLSSCYQQVLVQSADLHKVSRATMTLIRLFMSENNSLIR